MTAVTVFVDFEVTDREALHAYAVRFHVERVGMSAEEADEHCRDADGRIDPSRCLRLIVDPLDQIDGAECIDSSAEALDE